MFRLVAVSPQRTATVPCSSQSLSGDCDGARKINPQQLNFILCVTSYALRAIMSKNILIINSLPDSNQPLINLFNELSQKKYSFFLLSNKSGLISQFKLKQWPAKKAYLGPSILNFKINSFLFLILLPLFFVVYFIYLLYYKYSKKITSIICIGGNEKIIFTLLAKIIKIKAVWTELPDADFASMPKFIVWMYKINSKWASIAVLTNFTKILLEKIGVEKNRIKIIPLGIKLNCFEYQDTIFNKLAKNNKDGFQKKYFTVGTIVDLSQQQKIEVLLKAIKHCLTVIPNLQLIVVGSGEERKSLVWLAKKMEIDNIVWFVGEQSRVKKWLESFDVFIATAVKPNINDFNILIHAMSAGLPIVCQSNIGLDDMVREDKNGLLIEMDSSEALAIQIINLQQNKRLRLNFGKNSRELAEKDFSISAMAEKFEKILM